MNNRAVNADPSSSGSGAARWLAGDWLFRVGVPVYIAFGAVMKLASGRPLQLPIVGLIRDPSAEVERWAGLALPVIGAAELALAGVIFFGGHWARWLALAVMLVFAGVLVPHVRAEAESCGCFGAVSANPTLMLITALCAGALIVLLPCSGAPPIEAQRGRRLAVGWCAGAAVLAAVVTVGQVPERLGWRVPMLRLRPDTWAGMKLTELPFYPHLERDSGITVGPGFTESEQTWVLWLRTCPHCHEYFREHWREPTTRRVVAVEIPLSAGGVSAVPHSIDCPSCVRMHLRSGTFYFLPSTPVVLSVRDGIVTGVDVNPAPAQIYNQEQP